MNRIDRFDERTFPDKDQDLWAFEAADCPVQIDGNELIRLAQVNARDYSWLPCDLRGWIAIADGMPPNDDEVQYSEGEDQGYGSYCDCGSWIIQRDERDDFDHNPTHWQPAPWQPVILDSADSEEG